MDCLSTNTCFGLMQITTLQDLEDPLDLSDESVLVGLHGGPYTVPPWEPEPAKFLLASAKQQQHWELGVIIYDLCFLVVLAALAIGQLARLLNGMSRCVDYLSKRFFLGHKMAEMPVEDWNKIHIAKYTPFKVDYVKSGTEDYRLHIEDYRELLRVLSFVDEHGGI